jgi:hypothetical protein
VLAIVAELVTIALEKAVEFGLVFARKDGQFGGESMFEGILASSGLARFGSRPGTELRIGLIRVDLR